MSVELATLVLAAGASKRMGSPKALLPWGKGENRTVLNYLLDSVLESPRSLFIITGAHHNEIGKALPEWVNNFHYNSEWEKGMGNSLVFGIEKIKSLMPDAEAVLILLADQPLIDSEYIRNLRSCAVKYPEQVIASKYQEGYGVPAIIPESYWKELLIESADQGAKSWLRRQNEILSPEMIPDLRDMDDPGSYQELHKHWLKKQEKTL